jgi:dolichyl-phosphate beta-glucosyltransferase
VRPWFRRFAAVGLFVTAVDVGLLVLLARVLDVPVILADVIALLVAATISLVLHRFLAFTDDPFARWIHLPLAFVVPAIMAGLMDVAVLQTLVSASRLDDGLGLVWVKLPAVAVAAAVRQSAYRALLFHRVRRDLDERIPRPPAPGDVRLSVVVPAVGEEARIAATVHRLRAELVELRETGGLEIVVVDDGSTDATAAVARAAGADQVVTFPENRGKGAAVRAGMNVAHGRTLAFTDADLAYPPSELMSLVLAVEDGWDVVVGSRKHTDTTTLVRAGRLREIGGRVINLFTHAVLLGQYRDTQCGIKAFRSDVARLLFSKARVDGFAFDVELFHLVERYRLSLAEVAVTVENSARSTVRVAPDAARLLRDLARVRRWAVRGFYEPATGELESLVPAGPPDASH